MRIWPGVSASFYCSFNTELQQWAHVSGTKGSISVRDFVLPHCAAGKQEIGDIDARDQKQKADCAK